MYIYIQFNGNKTIKRKRRDYAAWFTSFGESLRQTVKCLYLFIIILCEGVKNSYFDPL